MNSIKVFGHASPDTDATCSAVVWSWFISTHRARLSTAYVLGTPNTEAQFVLEKWGVDQPPVLEQVVEGEEVAIVDTNNIQELFPNINETNIISIIDHHKLTGGIETSNPVEIVIQPYACTMTVMFTVMNLQVQELPTQIAGLMLSGIISDTLEFRSPTTTETDRQLAQELAVHVGIDIHVHATEMFEAKSDVSVFSDSELLRMDSKKYQVGEINFRVSVVETTNPQAILVRKEGLMSAMDTVAEEDGVDQVLLFVVDILQEQSTMLIPNELTRTVAEKSFGARSQEDSIVLPGVVSRKKQIIPQLQA